MRVNSPSIKATAYKTLVRPLLEYSSTVWDPYTQGNINKIEAVQKRAARYCLNRYEYTASVGEMIKQLEWNSLESRRAVARLAMFYKIVNGLVAIPKDQYLRPITQSIGTRHTHNLRFEVPLLKANYYKFSFYPRTIKEWNSLPGHIVGAPSLDAFKHQVAKHLLA